MTTSHNESMLQHLQSDTDDDVSVSLIFSAIAHSIALLWCAQISFHNFEQSRSSVEGWNPERFLHSMAIVDQMTDMIPSDNVIATHSPYQCDFEAYRGWRVELTNSGTIKKFQSDLIDH